MQELVVGLEISVLTKFQKPNFCCGDTGFSLNLPKGQKFFKRQKKWYYQKMVFYELGGEG